MVEHPCLERVRSPLSNSNLRQIKRKTLRVTGSHRPCVQSKNKGRMGRLESPHPRKYASARDGRLCTWCGTSLQQPPGREICKPPGGQQLHPGPLQAAIRKEEINHSQEKLRWTTGYGYNH